MTEDAAVSIAGFPRDVVKKAARALVDISSGFYAPTNPKDWFGKGMEQTAHIHSVTQSLLILLRTQQTEWTPLSAVVIEVMDEQGLLPKPPRQRVQEGIS